MTPRFYGREGLSGGDAAVAIHARRNGRSLRRFDKRRRRRETGESRPPVL